MKTSVIVCLMVALGSVGESAAQNPTTPKSEPDIGSRILPLIKALGDKDANVRAPAILELKSIGPSAKAAIPALIEALRFEEDPDQIDKALEAIGPEAIMPLVAALKDKDARMRARAAGALGRFGPRLKPAVPALSAALKDDDRSVRLAVVHASGAIGPEAKDAVADLAEVLRDKDTSLRLAAVSALGSIGPGAGKAVPAIGEMLNDESVDIRLIAVSALGEIGAANQASIPALLSVLKNDAVPVRSRAVFALGQIGSNAKSASPALVELLKDEDLREEAATALRRIGPDAGAVPVLIEVLQHKSLLRSRQLAATVLSAIGSDAKDAVPALIESLQDEPTQQFAIHALGRIGPEARNAVPALTQLLKSKTYYIRAGAAEALGRIGPDAKVAIPALTEALKDEHAQVRRYAMEALKWVEGCGKERADER